MAPISSSTSEIAGYAYVMPPGSNQTTDGELLESTEEGHFVMVNGTLIRIMMKKPFRDSDLNELLYVIIVIVFYATALMTLIITQIKRQRREGTDVDYYDEYLQRNQEVKRTCQTATTIVLKTDKPPSTIGTASTSLSGDRGYGSSASLLEPPGRTRDLSPRSGQRYGFGLMSAGRGAAAGVGAGSEDVGYNTPSVSPRELSPMLESIPDIGT